MNRTWKDAACEVAWNKIIRCILKWPDLSFKGFYIEGFLQGYTNDCCLGRKQGKEDILIGEDFSTFRAAFMKWLDENEVKK